MKWFEMIYCNQNHNPHGYLLLQYLDLPTTPSLSSLHTAVQPVLRSDFSVPTIHDNKFLIPYDQTLSTNSLYGTRERALRVTPMPTCTSDRPERRDDPKHHQSTHNRRLRTPYSSPPDGLHALLTAYGIEIHHIAQPESTHTVAAAQPS